MSIWCLAYSGGSCETGNPDCETSQLVAHQSSFFSQGLLLGSKDPRETSKAGLAGPRVSFQGSKNWASRGRETGLAAPPNKAALEVRGSHVQAAPGEPQSLCWEGGSSMGHPGTPRPSRERSKEPGRLSGDDYPKCQELLFGSGVQKLEEGFGHRKVNSVGR